ncbi:hypothetical protein M2119_001087 [Aurantimicrobium minutum]|uniref:DUF4395 domain-containing protein n=1 Tax=Aurantimicrobium minutum TaxID=708131 RepID=UPI002473C42B|nr:DUF4395 domain-containing protein [Aurantimicrobium minutum]MDH6532850.1 hypothetical protein [Aurantimicrobium minutum]
MTNTAEPQMNPQRRWSSFGEIVEGYDIPVFNEREVRASAGILFIIGFSAYLIAWTTGIMQPLRAFGMLFMIDMVIRLFLTPRYSPTLAVARMIVRNQRPEFVGAPQKRFAWGLGLGIALPTCLALGVFNAPNAVALVMCGICMAVLFLETAFGICVGCELQKRFSRTAPQYCPGDSCNYTPTR